MVIGINGISNYPYNNQIGKLQVQKNTESVVSENIEEQESQTEKKQITAEEKIKQANEFWAQHDALYAQQMATVMDTIGDGMHVAQEIARRMSSGAKVSPADEQNLMLYDPRMYAAAKNAQMMAQKKEDKSDESLIEDFEKRHANDRKDWTSELDVRIGEMQQYEVDDAKGKDTKAVSSTISPVQSTQTPVSAGSIDITI